MARSEIGKKKCEEEGVLGNVTCDEDLAGLAGEDDALGYAGVGAAYPEDLNASNITVRRVVLVSRTAQERVRRYPRSLIGLSPSELEKEEEKE